MFRDYTLQTTWRRASIAFFSGAMVGATLLTMDYLLGRFLSDGAPVFFEHILKTSPGIFWTAFYFCILGLLFLGVPAWLLAHFTGYRTWAISIIIGLSVPFIATILANLLIASELNIRIWSAIENAAKFSLFGPPIAFTIWRIAYRRPPPC